MTDPKLSADRFWSLRNRAEMRLRETPDQGFPQPSDALLHRIELELQNEDLLRANRQLESLRDSYRRLFDFAPLGYCLLDHEGRDPRRQSGGGPAARGQPGPAAGHR